MKKILEVHEDPDSGELMLEFPPDLMNQMGWSEGDVLEWFDNQDGSWSITKKDNQ